MGNAASNVEDEHNKMKTENAELQQQIIKLKEQMTIAENDNNRQNIVLRAKEQAKMKKQKRIDDIKTQIVDLKKQNQTDLLQYDQVKQQLTKLQIENTNKTKTLKEKQNIKFVQTQTIKNMKTQMHQLHKEKEEMKHNIDLIKYLQCKEIKYPITLTLTDHNLYRNTFAKSDLVILQGLKSRPEWNGKLAKICGSFILAKERWPVKTLRKPWAKCLVKTENLVLYKRGTLSDIVIGSTITIEDVADQGDTICVGYPYNGCYSPPKNMKSTINKQMQVAQLTQFKDEKISIMDNIIQLNNNEKIENLLIKNDWDVKKAIDEYYFDQFKRETDTIKYMYVWEWLDDDMQWKPYNKQLNDSFDNLSVGSLSSYHWFFEGAHKYVFKKLSIDAGQQTNCATNKMRSTRRIKVKQSEGCKYPQFWSSQGCTYHDFDNNDLYYMSSEVLPIEEDYIQPKYVYLDMQSNMAQEIMNSFHLTAVKNQYKIIKIGSLQNRFLWDKYYSAKNALKKAIGKDKVNERNLWHGTDTDTIRKIADLGFRKEFNFTCYYGEGTYFAVNAGYSVSYCKKARNGVFEMLYCKALCGESAQGRQNNTLINWPIKTDATGQIYDSLVDNLQNPKIYVIHDDARVYPMFIVYFTKK